MISKRSSKAAEGIRDFPLKAQRAKLVAQAKKLTSAVDKQQDVIQAARTKLQELRKDLATVYVDNDIKRLPKEVLPDSKEVPLRTLRHPLHYRAHRKLRRRRVYRVPGPNCPLLRKGRHLIRSSREQGSMSHCEVWGGAPHLEIAVMSGEQVQERPNLRYVSRVCSLRASFFSKFIA
eukprot:2255983-Amphidinium_carterae.1